MGAFVVAVLVALAVQPPLLALLRRADVLDHPSHRSSHIRPTLRGGGVAVVIAIVGAIAYAVLGGEVSIALVLPAGIAVIGLGTLGFLEDARGVSARLRLVGQALVGLSAGAVAMAHGAAGWVAAAMVVAVVVYANAFNFMDGVNGISGLNAAFAGLTYAAVGTRYDATEIVIVGLAVAGAAMGFLPFNFPAARVFLGDSGSYALGGVLAVLAVQCLAAGASSLLCVAPLSVYLADTGWTLLTRMRRGASLAVAHREHVYQRLADSAPGHVAAAGATVVVAALVTVAAASSAGTGVGDLAGAAIGAFVVTAYLVVPTAATLAPAPPLGLASTPRAVPTAAPDPLLTPPLAAPLRARARAG